MGAAGVDKGQIAFVDGGAHRIALYRQRADLFQVAAQPLSGPSFGNIDMPEHRRVIHRLAACAGGWHGIQHRNADLAGIYLGNRLFEWVEVAGEFMSVRN